MRISDWSSDVCSSDLRLLVQMNRREAGQIARKLRESIGIGLEGMACGAAFRDRPREAPDVGATVDGDVAGPQTLDRKSLVEGKSGAVRLDLGGRPTLNTQHRQNNERSKKTPTA